MVEALNLDLEKVQTDLLTYKNILSKMAKGKERWRRCCSASGRRPPSGWRRRPRPRPRPPGTPPRRPGAPEPFPLPRLENTPPTHAPHDAPRTAARAAAPR